MTGYGRLRPNLRIQEPAEQIFGISGNGSGMCAVEDIDKVRQVFIIGPVRVQSEVEVLGEASGRAEDQLAQASAALEGQVAHHASVEQRVERVRQHNIPLGDKLVTQAAVARIEIDKPVLDHEVGSHQTASFLWRMRTLRSAS